MVNIFFTDEDPRVAARDSCDKYVVKIPVEVGLLLSAIHWRTGYTGSVASGDPLTFDADQRVLPAVGPYANSKVIKSTSETYGWLVKSTGNYNYAVTYGLELIEEYKKRYGKSHRTEGVLLWLKENIPEIPSGLLTTDVGLAMPNKYKDRANPTESYKKYIIGEKSDIVSWKRSEVPDWYERYVYTDGAASGNGTIDCIAGYAVWFGEDDHRNLSGAVKDNPSNQTAELLAITKALKLLRGEKYTIVTDSQYAIKCITEWIHTWEKNGWKTSDKKHVKHKELVKSAASLLGDSRFMHIRSHMAEPDKGSIAWQHWNGNKQADAYATAIVAKQKLVALNVAPQDVYEWHKHPDSSEYVYTTDVKLPGGYPLRHAESRCVVATVDDESVKELTDRDIEAVVRLQRSRC